MIVQAVDLFHVAMPLKAPWRTAFSEEVEIHSVLVRLDGGDVEGWGESAPYRAPNFSPEWSGGAFALLRDWLAPALVGQDIRDGADISARLAPFKGNYFAKAGLDIAFWDAAAKQRGQCLWRLIGGQGPTVAAGADIPVLNRIDELLSAVGEARDQGFPRVKLKFRRGWGLDMVRAVRGAFPDLHMHVDCNAGFTLADADMFRALDAYGLAMIEQPLAHNDLIDHARLQAMLETPICLDESLVSLDRTRKAIEIGACGWVNIKTGRVGGLTEAIAIHDYCRSRNVPCWIGGMLESALGQAPSMALATLPNVSYPCDVFPTSRLYAEDLSEPEIVLEPGQIARIPDVPGCGYAPNPERLRRWTVEHTTVRAG
jgi:O-succinylbenzoate synthase